jgi:hypothetical protein
LRNLEIKHCCPNFASKLENLSLTSPSLVATERFTVKGFVLSSRKNNLSLIIQLVIVVFVASLECQRSELVYYWIELVKVVGELGHNQRKPQSRRRGLVDTFFGFAVVDYDTTLSEYFRFDF